jgi:DHA2 family multidrug resistance protein
VFGIAAAGFTLIWLSWLNLNAGYWDFFWPQFIQGIAMSCLFVPLTTITMDPIPREEMGNATSIFNLLRNVGGSMGIAASATMLSRNRQMHTNILGVHVNLYSLQTRQWLSQLQAAMMARGSDATTASRRAAALVFYSVERQAAMLSFIDVFRLLGVIFLLTLPLVLIMKSPRVGRPGESPGMH